MAKSKKTRFGIFYKSQGRWVGPYCGATYTNYTITRSTMKAEIRLLANTILKSKVLVAPVS
jgi:hypothetical protein